VESYLDCVGAGEDPFLLDSDHSIQIGITIASMNALCLFAPTALAWPGLAEPKGRTQRMLYNDVEKKRHRVHYSFAQATGRMWRMTGS